MKNWIKCLCLLASLVPALAQAQTQQTLILGVPAIGPSIINGGTINNTPIGAMTPSTGAFTTLTATSTSNAVNALGSAGGTRTHNFTLGNVVTATVSTSANTFAVTNPPSSGTYGGFTLILTNGGSQSVTWMTTTIWGGGVAPTLTTSGVDVLTFFTINGGTTWYGFLVGADVK